MKIRYENTLTAEDYNALRQSAVWQTIHPEQAEESIKGSALIIAALDNAKTA